MHAYKDLCKSSEYISYFIPLINRHCDASPHRYRKRISQPQQKHITQSHTAHAQDAYKDLCMSGVYTCITKYICMHHAITQHMHRMHKTISACPVDLWKVFSYYRTCSLTTECILFLENVFSACQVDLCMHRAITHSTCTEMLHAQTE